MEIGDIDAGAAAEFAADGDRLRSLEEQAIGGPLGHRPAEGDMVGDSCRREIRDGFGQSQGGRQRGPGLAASRQNYSEHTRESRWHEAEERLNKRVVRLHRFPA
jgi:hypothetical protein